MVRTRSARHREPLVLGGHDGSGRVRQTRRSNCLCGQDHNLFSIQTVASNPT
jgi:hypothetical protein